MSKKWDRERIEEAALFWLARKFKTPSPRRERAISGLITVLLMEFPDVPLHPALRLWLADRLAAISRGEDADRAFGLIMKRGQKRIDPADIDERNLGVVLEYGKLRVEGYFHKDALEALVQKVDFTWDTEYLNDIYQRYKRWPPEAFEDGEE